MRKLTNYGSRIITNPSRFEKESQRIKLRFLSNLREWMPRFESFGADVEKNIANQALTLEIGAQVHKLSGSAETFGFPKLTELARDVESCLDELQKTEQKETVSTLQTTFEMFVQEAGACIAMQQQSTEANISIPPVPEHSQNSDLQDYDFRILAIDDDPLIRMTLKLGLRDVRCDLEQAGSGEEALHRLDLAYDGQAEPLPDLIVLDLNMPNMNGFEVLKRIKNTEHTASIPVIMLTSSSADEHVVKGLSYGAIDYVTKPFSVKALCERIVTMLKRNRIRVLIADDDDLIRDLLSRRLQRLGYSILIAKDGVEAVRIATGTLPDLAILDIMMPGIDGISALKHIRSNIDTANIPVVLLTAKSQPENIVQGLTDGANDYITKPFDIDEVAARISGILQRRKAL